MPDLDHLKTVKAVVIAVYGLLYLIMAIWLIARGSQEDWGRRVPGRVVLGVFLVFSCYREWDTTYVLIRYGRTAQATASNTDAWSVLPLMVGATFGIWAAYRFFRNTVGTDNYRNRQSVVAERIADSSERLADATEQLVEQGAYHGPQ